MECQKKRHVCPLPGCNKSFTQKSDATRHLLNVHHGRKYECPLCEKAFSSKEMVKAHRQNVHEHKRWECVDCQKIFRWQCNFTKHNCRGGPLKKPHKCPNCTKSYAHISGLSRHKRSCAATASRGPGHEDTPRNPNICVVSKTGIELLPFQGGAASGKRRTAFVAVGSRGKQRPPIRRKAPKLPTKQKKKTGPKQAVKREAASLSRLSAAAAKRQRMMTKKSAFPSIPNA
jgi:uncharacterized Zn-finger protein